MSLRWIFPQLVRRLSLIAVVIGGGLVPCLGSRLLADEFVYRDENGNSVSTQARLIGTGSGFHALERWDGQIQLVPTDAVLERKNLGDPVPATCQQMAEILEERFGKDLTRIAIKDPYVVVMVLSDPLDRSAESAATAFLRKSVRFMGNVDGVFSRYARSMRFPLEKPRFPLVLVIFESDEDFDEYTREIVGDAGLSPSSILGFYYALTNWLAVRMSSCDSFEVPLHEAIHQQMFNRVLSRLAPTPKWFDEGIATGFQGDGERVNVHPGLINSHYAFKAYSLTGQIDWNHIIESDEAFVADVLAGEAYTLAWCLHWMLITEYKEKYRDFVQQLAQRKPLEEMSGRDRVDQFESVFGVSVSELQSQFPKALQLAARRQKINLSDGKTAGLATSQQALGEFEIQAVRVVDGDSQIQLGGNLRNISPLRAMTFYVTVELESGHYAQWLLPDVKPRRQVALSPQVIRNQSSGGGSVSDRFRVWVRSTASGSAVDEQWKNGTVPGPKFISSSE